MIVPYCREVARLVASGEIDQKGPVARFLIQMHFKMCGCCSRYTKQIQALGELVRQKNKQEVDPTTARQLEDRIIRKLSEME